MSYCNAFMIPFVSYNKFYDKLPIHHVTLLPSKLRKVMYKWLPELLVAYLAQVVISKCYLYDKTITET